MSTAEQEQVTLQITGMTCGNCANHVQEGLTAVAGVERAMVDLAGEKATVTFDPAQVKRGQLVEAVKESGYGVADK